MLEETILNIINVGRDTDIEPDQAIYTWTGTHNTLSIWTTYGYVYHLKTKQLEEEVNHQPCYKPYDQESWPEYEIYWFRDSTNALQITNHSLIRFKTYSMRCNPYLTLLRWLII